MLTLGDLRANAILSGLEDSQAAVVVKSGAFVDLRVKDEIYKPNEPIDEVFFPLDCVLSVVTRMQDGSQIEVGTIGREGVSAIPLLLGGSSTANESYCQVPGKCIKISADLFQGLRADPTFRKLLDRYVQAYVNMLGQLAACNRLHRVYERCARWLLMTHDRVGSADIRLTHEYLAMMLGTQRSGVTIAAATLQHAGMIRYAKGVITILNRAASRIRRASAMGSLESNSATCDAGPAAARQARETHNRRRLSVQPRSVQACLAFSVACRADGGST